MQFLDPALEPLHRPVQFVQLRPQALDFLLYGRVTLRPNAQLLDHPLAFPSQSLGEVVQARGVEVFEGEFEVVHPTLDPLAVWRHGSGCFWTLGPGTFHPRPLRTIRLAVQLGETFHTLGVLDQAALRPRGLLSGPPLEAPPFVLRGFAPGRRLDLQLISLPHHPQGLLVPSGGLQVTRLLPELFHALAQFGGRWLLGIGLRWKGDGDAGAGQQHPEGETDGFHR